MIRFNNLVHQFRVLDDIKSLPPSGTVRTNVTPNLRADKVAFFDGKDEA